MGRKIKALFYLFISIIFFTCIIVGIVVGSLEEIKSNFFGWLGDREGQYKNQTQALEDWLNTVTDKEFNFDGQVFNKAKFKMYLQDEKYTYFNDRSLKVAIKVDGTIVETQDYTLGLYDSSFEYRVPWQFVAGLDMLLGESDSKKTKYLKKIRRLFKTEYYGLTINDGKVTEEDIDRAIEKEGKGGSQFRYYKTITKKTYGENPTTKEVKYPKPYFTKIITPFSTYDFEYTIEEYIKTSKNKEGTIISETITREPVLSNINVTDNSDEFLQNLKDLGLNITDMLDLVEFVSHMPYGEQVVPLLAKEEFGTSAYMGYGNDYYYGEGDVTVSNGILLWPAPKCTKISSPFGNRIHPISKKKKMHTGIDIPGPLGTDILAAEDGIISMAKVYGGYGNFIAIEHSNNMTTRYGHLSKILVRVGDTVKKGQVIGKMGSTGQSTGSHLHFEVLVNGVFQDPAKFVGVQSNLPNVLPSDLKYKDIDVDKAVLYLKKKNSYIDNKKDVLKIVKAGKERDINPLLLIAITGQEMSYIKNDYKYWCRVYGESNLLKKLKGISSSATLQDAPMYISNNPFNVYNAWWKKQPGLEESARVASNTIIKLSANRPNNIDPIKWMNMPKGVNPKGYYASDSEWNVGVKKHFGQLIKDVGYK